MKCTPPLADLRCSVIPPARYLALLCHQIWPSETIIPTITEVPVLFLSGLKDEIVPYVSPISLSIPADEMMTIFPSTKHEPFGTQIIQDVLRQL